MDWLYPPADWLNPPGYLVLIYIKIVLLKCLLFVRRENITIRISVKKSFFVISYVDLLNYPFNTRMHPHYFGDIVFQWGCVVWWCGVGVHRCSVLYSSVVDFWWVVCWYSSEVGQCSVVQCGLVMQCSVIVGWYSDVWWDLNGLCSYVVLEVCILYLIIHHSYMCRELRFYCIKSILPQ